jgi:hypothetical protein
LKQVLAARTQFGGLPRQEHLVRAAILAQCASLITDVDGRSVELVWLFR